MKYKLVIFDFDGTIADTGEGIIKSLVYALEKHSVPVPDEKFLRRFIGPPIYDSFINDYGATEENVFDFIKSYRERYFVKGIYECELYEGVVHMLKEIRKAGYLTGIASSKPEKLIYDVMNYTEITPLFDAICGVDLDESKKKSKAELIMLCAEKLGVEDTDSIIMVGERFYDIDGAKNAHTASAGMLYGYGSREEFEEHNADFIFGSAKELEEFLLSE